MKEYKQIETLLQILMASNSLRKNVFEILGNHSATLEIYPNTVINGLSIGLALKHGAKNVAFISPMQSGKSGSVFFLNYVLSEIGYLKPDQNILFLTSMRDTDLYNQNILNLQKQFFDFSKKEYSDSKIFVKKIDELFKYPDPFKIVKDRNIGLFVRDEDHFGAGINSTFDCGFMQELRAQLPEMPLVTVSATPFDIIDSINKGFDVTPVLGKVPEQYLGISKMLELGLVEDIDPSFTPFISRRDSRGGTLYEISPKFNEYMQHLLTFKDGVGIIRVGTSEEAFLLRRIATNRYRLAVKALAIGSDSGCDYSISAGMEQVKILVNTQKQRVLLIVVNALSAGKDFKSLKEKIRFGIETRMMQLANGAQGIPGRLCGYHQNRTFKLLASVPLLQKYSEFENNWELINDENWKNDLLQFGIRSLCTHVKLQQKRKSGEFTPIIKDPIRVSFNDLKTSAGRNQLDFLDDKTYKLILKAFDNEIWYEEAPFRLKSGKFKTTIRVASSYNKVDNRVYKLWGKFKKGDDFGSVMFKKKHYRYGILISNIPIGKKSKTGIGNEINFRGIEIYKAGTKTTIKSQSITNNHSMYNFQ
jgi:hypothetical protein